MIIYTYIYIHIYIQCIYMKYICIQMYKYLFICFYSFNILVYILFMSLHIGLYGFLFLPCSFNVRMVNIFGDHSVKIV